MMPLRLTEAEEETHVPVIRSEVWQRAGDRFDWKAWHSSGWTAAGDSPNPAACYRDLEIAVKAALVAQGYVDDPDDVRTGTLVIRPVSDA